MKSVKYVAIALLALVIVGCKNETLYPNAPTNPNKSLLIQLVNEYRISGCTCKDEYFQPVGLLSWNDTLEIAAKTHSEDMNHQKFFSHKGSDNSNAGERINRLGYSWSAWGENIAQGYISEEEVIKGWIESKGHCKNIMNANFKEMGVATSGSYWTQVFASQ